MKINKQKRGIKLLYCRTLSSQSGASITMGSLASFLRTRGHIVEIVFILRSDLHKSALVMDKIGEFPLIIYKPNFKDYDKFFNLLMSAKNDNLLKRVFLCGPFATLNAKSIMKKNKWVDGIILSNPEETTLELLNSFTNDFSEWNFACQGGIWRNPKSKKITFAKLRTTEISLNDLPFPSRDVEKKETVAYINLEASRGCIFNCSFCHVPLYHNSNKSSKRMVRCSKLVVDEIENLYKGLGKTLFIFNDPLFWASSRDDQRIRELCEEIIKRDLRIKMYVYLRCNPFPNEKLLQLMIRAGLVRVFLGIENASEQSLKNYKKATTVSKSLEAWNKLKNKGINLHIGYIVFEPNSNLEDIRINIEMLNDLKKLYRISVVLESPRIIPTSQMYSDLIREGLLPKNLSYKELTYGYKFKDEPVRKLFYLMRDTFLKKLKKRWYEVEYFCVSGLLLIDLAKKERGINTNLDELSKDFVKLTDETNKIIYFFYRTMLVLIEKDFSQNKADNITEKFIQKFLKKRDQLQYEWGKLVSKVNEEVGEQPYNELYRGVESIW